MSTVERGSVSGYTKLDSSIIDSSIWAEDDTTVKVWLTILAMKDQYGYVAASIVGLAGRARKTVPETQAALAKLMSPDPYSRTKDDEGRRIREVDGGWVVINHSKFREMGRSVDRRAYLAGKKRESRERKKRSTAGQPGQPPSTTGQPSQPVSTAVHPFQPISDSEAEAEAEGGDQRPPPPTCLRSGPVTGHELKRLFSAIRTHEFPETLPWQSPRMLTGKDSDIADQINSDPGARDDVAATMTLLFRSAKDGKRGKNSKQIVSNPTFAFACWLSDWTALREELRGVKPAARAKTSMEIAAEAEAASWQGR